MKRKKYFFTKTLFVLLPFFLITLFGCSSKDAQTARQESTQSATAEKNRITIGLIPEHNIFKQLERYKPLAGYLSEKTGLKIEMKVLSRYGNIIDNFLSLGLDGAFFGSFTYALAHSRIGVEVILRPEYLDGVSTYYGLLFVRKDSGIETIDDMKGQRFAFVDKATTAGYLLPLHYFKMNGIQNYKTYFRETYFTGTHEDAIYDVLNKKADVGAAKNTVFYRLARTDDRILSQLNIIERSPNVPENALAFRKDLEESVKMKVKNTLLNMHTTPDGEKILKDFGALRFIVTTDRDYQPVFLYARETGLNLSTYDYMND